MLARIISDAVVMDREDYREFKAELYQSFRRRPDIRKKFSSQYETLLVMNSVTNYMEEDNHGAVLRILLEGNRSVIPTHDDLVTLLRRLGLQNGKKELLKPPVSDATKKENPLVLYDESAFDKSLEYFARGIFRNPTRLEIIFEKPEKKESCNESLLAEERDYSVADLAEKRTHSAADYLATGMKYAAGAIKHIAHAAAYAASAVANRYRHRNDTKNRAGEEIDEHSSRKLDDACQKFEKEISSLRSISERGKIVSIYNFVTGEAVMTEGMLRHHEMRWTSLVPELLHTTLKYHIEQSPALNRILEDKVAAMVNGVLKAKKRADKRKE